MQPPAEQDHDHASHVMPDGTVMAGAGHPRHACAHAGAPVHATSPTPAIVGGQDEVEYTCPMHPQVRQRGPGSCPICGMALEPVLASAGAGESPELRDMSRRLWIGLALTAPVFALEMGGHVFDLHHLVAQQASNWIQLVLATPVALWAGWPFFTRAVASVKNRSLNMFTLIAIGTGAAWLYSIVGTLA
ncbi:MAG: heavy metal-binding domain-containing protein, partial [Betaproteobacteria bacterium]